MPGVAIARGRLYIADVKRTLVTDDGRRSGRHADDPPTAGPAASDSILSSLYAYALCTTCVLAKSLSAQVESASGPAIA